MVVEEEEEEEEEKKGREEEKEEEEREEEVVDEFTPCRYRNCLIRHRTTTIHLIMQFCAATIQERRLLNSEVLPLPLMLRSRSQTPSPTLMRTKTSWRRTKLF